MVTHSKCNISKPKTRTNSAILYPLPKALLVETTMVEPTCYIIAAKHPQLETSLVQTGISNKRKTNGDVECYKARPIAKGYLQQPSVDFSDPYSPVIIPIMVRTVLSIVVSSEWATRESDVHNSFLHVTLLEEVFMNKPQRYIHPHFSNHVCKLQKALYGLKQANLVVMSKQSHS